MIGISIINTSKKNAIAEDEDHSLPPEDHSVRDDNSQANNDWSVDNTIAS